MVGYLVYIELETEITNKYKIKSSMIRNMKNNVQNSRHQNVSRWRRFTGGDQSSDRIIKVLIVTASHSVADQLFQFRAMPP